MSYQVLIPSGLSSLSLPLTILALSVLKPCLGAFLDLNLGLPQSGRALSKKFCQALPRSKIANCKQRADN